MATNPYESPQTDCHAPENWQESALRVDGRYLVVPTETVLPPVCIRTNRTVSEADMVRVSLFWCSPWVAILALGGLLVIPALFLQGRRFTVTCGMIPSVRRLYRIGRICKTAAVIGCFVTLLLTGAVFVGMFVFYPSAVLDIGPAVIGKGVMFVLAVGSGSGFVSLLIGNWPLSLAKHRQGMFWVDGCSEEYLARFEGETASDSRVGS
jgi:hypothetical protein